MNTKDVAFIATIILTIIMFIWALWPEPGSPLANLLG